MESVEVLDVCTKVFQFFGLQCFSLKSLSVKGKIENISSWQKAYFGAVFITFSVIIGYWLETGSNKDEDGISVNSLNSIMKSIMGLLIVLSIAASLLVSYYKNHDLMDFFLTSEMITTVCWIRLNYKTDLRNLKRDLKTMMWRFFVCIGLINVAFYVGVYYYENELFVPAVISTIPVLIICLSVLRFGVYVFTVNFHLKFLKSLISEQLSNFFVSQKFTSKNAWKNEQKQKILALRKIHTMIERMTSIVNSSLGFTVQIILSFIVARYINDGYRAFIIVVASLPLAKFEGDFNPFIIGHD